MAKPVPTESKLQLANKIAWSPASMTMRRNHANCRWRDHHSRHHDQGRSCTWRFLLFRQSDGMSRLGERAMASFIGRWTETEENELAARLAVLSRLVTTVTPVNAPKASRKLSTFIYLHE